MSETQVRCIEVILENGKKITAGDIENAIIKNGLWRLCILENEKNIFYKIFFKEM